MTITKGNEMSDDDRKPRKTGCAILFVPTLIVINIVGVLSGSLPVPFFQVVSRVGLVGLVCGVALGGCLFAKTKQSTNYSLSFWLALGGLVGYFLPIFIVITIYGFLMR